MAEISVNGVLQLALGVGAKVAYTVILAGIVVLCVSEGHKIWFDRSPVLAVFDYSKDGAAAPASGEGFTRGIQQQQSLLRGIYEGRGQIRTNRILPQAAGQQFAGLSVTPELRTSDLSELKIEAQGINLTAILGRLRNWIRQPNEIRGRVDEVGGRYHVYAEWRQAKAAGGQGKRHYSEIHTETGRAIFEVAARLLWQDIGALSDAPPLAQRLIDKVTEDNFVKFMRAWVTYQTHAAARGRQENLDPYKAQLETAINDADNLVSQNVDFPLVYNLAARLHLEATAFTDMDAEEQAEVRGLAARYVRSMAALGLPDPETEQYFAALDKNDQAAQRVATAQTTIAPSVTVSTATVAPSPAPAATTPGAPPATPAQPAPAVPARAVALAGASIGPEGVSTAASACCIAQDAAGKRFLLTADYLFSPELQGRKAKPVVISPAALDGGTEPIGALSRVRDLDPAAGVALIALDPDVEARNEIPGVGLVTETAPFPGIGETVRLFGRSSELRSGKVLLEMDVPMQKQSAITSAMVPVERISGPGDGGAPVVDSLGRLVGMAYAGSELTSLILPIEKVLADLGLTLVTP